MALILLVAIAAATARGGDPPVLTDKQAGSEYKQAVASHLKFLKGQVKIFAKQFCDQMDAAAVLAITSPVAPEALLTIVAGHIANAHAQAAQVIALVTDTIESDGAQLLGQTTGHPSAFLLGDCGVIDKARDDLVKELLKFRDTLRKKLKKIAKLLGKNGYEMGALVEPPQAAGIAPNPGESEPPFPGHAQLRVDFIVGISGADAAGDGSLALGGSADPASGEVEVRIYGPNGTEAELLDIPVVNGRWSATFATGVLPEGNYRMTVAQDDIAYHTVDGGLP